VTLRFSALDIGYEHLDVSVSAEAALLRGLANMKCGWVAVECLFDSAIQGGKLGENGKDAWRFVLHLFLLDKAAVTANAVDDGDLGPGLKLIMKPFGHAFFPGVGTELRFLESSALDVKRTSIEPTPRRALLLGGLINLSSLKGLKVKMLLDNVLFSLLLVPLLSRRCLFLVLPLLLSVFEPSKDSVSYR
jgi:hypothetical protein